MRAYKSVSAYWGLAVLVAGKMRDIGAIEWLFSNLPAGLWQVAESGFS